MASSSEKETKSDDVSLCPRKVHRTVYVARLLGGIGGVLGSKFFVP